MTQNPTIYSIGHSNHPMEQFITLLKQHKIETLADVRSYPHSRYFPHFNRRALEARLTEVNIRYVFAGESLGGRPADDRFYDTEGRVLYGKMTSWQVFTDGVDMLRAIAGTAQTVMMCSEGDPAECHRYLLITKVLEHSNTQVEHILRDGSLKPTSLVSSYDKLMSMTAPTLLGVPGENIWKSVKPVPRRT